MIIINFGCSFSATRERLPNRLLKAWRILEVSLPASFLHCLRSAGWKLGPLMTDRPIQSFSALYWPLRDCLSQFENEAICRRQGGWLAYYIEPDSPRKKGMGDPSETHGDFCGRISRREDTSGGSWAPLHKGSKAGGRGRWGGKREGKLPHSVACHISSDLAFGVFSQYRVSISSQLFNIYSIQGIIHSMISWHGLCSIWSNLYAFILRAAL